MVFKRKVWEEPFSDQLHMSLAGQHYSIVLWEGRWGKKMSWSLSLWIKPFLCRLNSKFIMLKNSSRRLSLDFQQSISEVRKLPLSFQYPAEDLNWKRKKSYFSRDLTKAALYWFYYQLFSVKAKRRKRWLRRNKTHKKYRSKFFSW